MDLVKIRPAVLRDISDMLGLLEMLFSLEDDFQFDAKRQRAGLKVLLNGSPAQVIVADDGGRVIGMCTGQPVISTAQGGPALLVEDVVVAPAYRGQGIGTRLLKALSRWAANQSISRLQLLADRNNTEAIEFYLKTGWQTTQLICLRTFSDDQEK